MKKKELIEKIKYYENKIRPYKIVIDDISYADFILGCYFDKSSNLWKVYINEERGMHGIIFETTSEDEAFDELFSMVKFEYDIDNR